MTRARDNPFAVHRVEAIRYRPQGWTWDQLLRRLADLDYRAAVVGPHGSGKTTLLEDLERRLRATGFNPVPLRLTAERPALPGTFPASPLDQRHVILLDGAEQLSRLGWWRFSRAVRTARGLIVTTHRPGLLPTLVDCATTPQLLATIIHDLTDDAELCRPDVVAPLFAQHRGNVRDALRDLYDTHGEPRRCQAGVPAPSRP